jgi:hypothetical protein
LASILFHAGMSKSGSTSLQQWLGSNVVSLREHGLTVVRIRQPAADAPITVIPAGDAAVVSRLVPGANAAESRPAAIGALCAALDECATRTGDLLVTSESYEIVFQRREPEVLAHLDALAARHEVRVVYYVRPQNEWLESAWGQWGFRQPLAADKWVRRQRSRIDYIATLRAALEHAPHVWFDIRPLRRDLLAGGDVVNDFAGACLGLDLGGRASAANAANPSLPLDVTILLRDAPPGLFWSSIHDNKRFYRLKQLVSQWEVPDSPAVTRSRVILRRYAHDTFEAGNRELIRCLGWPTGAFIPPVEEPTAAAADLAELDELWSSGASAAQRAVLYSALNALLAAGETDGGSS